MSIYVVVATFLWTVHAGAETVHHDLQARFSPETHEIWATDEVILFDRPQSGLYQFRLASGLVVKNPEAKRLVLDTWTVPVVVHSDGRLTAKIDYEGTIFDPVQNDESEGLIDPAGISLFGSSRWYPQRADDLVTFSLKASLPGGWTMITQSTSGLQPQEEIFLIAGAFFNYYGPSGALPSYSVHLRSQEADLAKTYLSKIPEFLTYYSDEIAPYPYRSFQVVENFWETGLGMPSFTLLGSSVIRLPFLLTSSLPHEILHNWWGNGVYVDYARGNWSEGLTSYMADHWQKAIEHRDDEYRRGTIALFQDYVHKENDFPVRKFRGRHNAGTQAVGYGKSLFFFHMLKQRLGEETFRRGLRLFFERNLYRRASFDEIQAAMEEVSGESLAGLFQQWLDRVGIPQLELVSANPTQKSGRFGAQIKLRQQSSTGIYDLRVPVQLTLIDGSIVEHFVDFKSDEESVHLPARAAVKKISVDPRFDVFRSLYPEERPPSVSLVLGREKAHFVRTSDHAENLAFVRTWANSFQEFTDRLLKEEALPKDGALIFIGPSQTAQNLFNTALEEQGVHVDEKTVRLGEATYNRAEHAIALVARIGDQPVLWAFWPEGTDASRLAERLRHYSTFGAVGFKGQPNVLKQSWRVTRSPLTKSY